MRFIAGLVATTAPLVVLAAACRFAPTSVLVRLDTDAPAQRALAIRAEARRGERVAGEAALATWTRGAGANDVALPATFAVTPGEGAPRDGTVTLVVEATVAAAQQGDPPVVLRRIARFAFVPRATFGLRMFLAMSCGNATTGCTSVARERCTVGVRCEERGQTCGDDGECVSQVAQLEAVDDVAAFTDATADRAAPPGGVDAGVDAGDAADAGAAGDATTDEGAAGDAADGGDAGDARVDGGVAVARMITGLGDHTCAAVAGAARCWGSNTFGQLGDGTRTSRLRPVAIAGIDPDWLTLGAEHSCSREAAHIICWGRGANGRLGDGASADSLTPVRAGLTGIPGADYLTVGAAHNCIAGGNGLLGCWGANASGQIGDGTTMDALRGTPIDTRSNGFAPALGGAHSCTVVMSPPRAECWGNNAFGQLGDGSTMNRLTSVAVLGGLTNVASLALGGAHTCALRTDGSVACWGRNTAGQVGSGVASSSVSLPATLRGLTGVAQLGLGESHSCARLTSGAVLCWGSNARGQLGDGTTTNRLAPTPVPGLSATAIAVGREHTCAVLRDQTARCWGRNAEGQLGTGDTTDRRAPAPVAW